jgi:hypothetical protein
MVYSSNHYSEERLTMTEQNYEVCSICGVKRNTESKQFLFASGDKPSANKVYDRVCVFAKNAGKVGCINTEHTADGSEGWMDWSSN